MMGLKWVDICVDKIKGINYDINNDGDNIMELENY